MSEEYYDKEIAPKLLEIARLCKEKKLPFLATVWFEDEDSGTTRVFPSESNPSFTLAHMANRCRGNIDKLCLALVRLVPIENDTSVVLRLLRGTDV